MSDDIKDIKIGGISPGEYIRGVKNGNIDPTFYRAIDAILWAADEIARLSAENFALAADQCHAGYGDEYGNHRCKEIDRLSAENAAMLTEREIIVERGQAAEARLAKANTVKYIARAGSKGNELEDLKKARWYLDREISNLERLMT